MPTLRWLGLSGVTSLPSMTIRPEVGPSKPATMRSTVVLPQPEGPSSEMNSPCSMPRSKPLTTTFWANCLRTSLICRNAIAPLPRASCALGLFLCRADHVDQAHAGPGHQEGDDRQGRRLIGAVGADQLQG